MTSAPFLRGLFLNALSRPVIMHQTGQPTTLELGADLLSVNAQTLEDIELPVVVSTDEEIYEVIVTKRGKREISGHVAPVTNEAQGFGAEIAEGLVERGCFVYIVDLDAEDALMKLEKLGSETTRPIIVNVAGEEFIAAVSEEIERITGGINLVVSNAGIVHAGSVLEQDASTFRLSTDINYAAFFLVAKHLGGVLSRQHTTSGVRLTDIIQINLKSGLVGSNRDAAYTGSKFGSIGLVQFFTLEFTGHGVRVNTICPDSSYDRPLWSDPEHGLLVQYLKSGKVPGAKMVADVKEFYKAEVPIRRETSGIDVLHAVYYIVEQAYETSQALPVTGGQVVMN